MVASLHFTTVGVGFLVARCSLVVHTKLVQRPVSVNCLRKLLVMPVIDRPDKCTEDWGNFVKIILLQVLIWLPTFYYNR